MTLKLKFKKPGSRNNTRHVMHKTDQTRPYSESRLEKVERGLSRPFPAIRDPKKEGGKKGRRRKRGPSKMEQPMIKQPKMDPSGAIRKTDENHDGGGIGSSVFYGW
jgi:hypothetical protein